MNQYVEFLLSVIAILIGFIAYVSRGFIKWSKEKIDEHIADENKFKAYALAEIDKINASIDFFLKDLKPIIENVEKIPNIEKKIEHIELNIKHIEKHIKR